MNFWRKYEKCKLTSKSKQTADKSENCFDLCLQKSIFDAKKKLQDASLSRRFAPRNIFLKILPIVWIWQFRRHFRSGRNYGFWFFISLVSSFVGTCLEVLFGSFNFDAVDAGMLVKGCTRKDFNSSSSSRLKNFKFLMVLKFSVLKLQNWDKSQLQFIYNSTFSGKMKMSWKIDKIGNSAFWPFSKNEKLRKNIQIFGYFLILKMLKKNCEKIRQMTRRRCCHVNLTKNNKLRKFRFRLSAFISSSNCCKKYSSNDNMYIINIFCQWLMIANS